MGERLDPVLSRLGTAPRAPARTPVRTLTAVLLGSVISWMLWPQVGAAASEPLEVLEAADTGGLETQSAALMLSGQEGGGLAVSILTVPWPGAAGEGERIPVAVVLDIDGSSLLAAGGSADTGGGESAEAEPEHEGGVLLAADELGETVLVEVDVYAVDEAGNLAGYLTQAFVVEVAAVAGRDDWAGVKFFAGLDLPPGEHSLRVLVRQRDSGELALRVLPVTVPGAAPPPLFGERADRWTLVRQAAGAGKASTAPIFPLDLGDTFLIPSTRPVIAAGRSRPFALLGSGWTWPGAAADGVAGLSARLELRQGGESIDLSLPPAGPPRSLGGVEGATPVRDAEFPGDLVSPGEYTLALSPGGGAPVSLPVVVVPPSLAETREPMWTDLLALTTGEAPPPNPEALLVTAQGHGRKRDPDVARIQSGYLEALARAGAGDWPAALSAVSDVESEGLASGTPDEALIRAQLEVALGLSGERPDHLLPLVRLHEELYVENRRTHRYRLAAHSRRITQWLVELYAENSGSNDAGSVAAGALVSLAGHLLRGGNSLEGMAVLERALQHEPKHATALLTLASGYEILGDYKKTVDLLRRYLEVRPASAEGKLRLGVNLARLGSPKPALGLLGEAVAAGEPAWVAAVAYEELASLLARQGRPNEAAERLRQALERFPDEQRLYIQLAAILDRSGQTVEARATLANLDRRLLRQSGGGAGSGGGSPRLRYSQWPLADLEDNRRAFITYASSRLSGFAEAVTQLTAEGGQGP